MLLGVALRPFGDDLLTRGGSTYLIFMCVVMLIIALVEGLAWGHALSTSSWLFGVAIGVLIFVFMLALDISLATQNLLEEEHELKLDQPTDVIKPKFLSKEWLFQIVKGKFGLSVRLIIAGVSLWITAGFVTEFIFKSEIQQKIASIQTQYIADKKNDIIIRAENDSKKLDAQRQNKETERTNEANKGGVGDRTQMLMRDLQKIDADIQSIVERKTKDLAAIDDAYNLSKKTGSYDAMIAAGVQIAADSPTARGQIIDDLKNGKNSQAFWRTEWAVRVIMFILAFGLVLFKLGQKRELALYYSSRLQEKWSQYQLGIFDEYLPEEKRYSVLKNAHSQLPEEFERIMIAYATDKPRIMQEREAQKQRERDAIEKIKQEQERLLEIEKDEQERIRLRDHHARIQADLEAQQQRDIEKAEQERIRVRDHDMRVQADLEAQQQLEIEKAEQERIRLRDHDEKIEQEKWQDEYAVSEQVYLENLAKERALQTDHEEDFNYRLNNLKRGMEDLQNMEVSYLQRHQADLNELKIKEDDLLKKFTKLQKDYRTQEEQIEKRRLSIEEEEVKLANLNLKLKQSKLSEDSHREHVMEMVIYFVDAIGKKQDYIRGKEYRLREFENSQQFFKENCDQVHVDLDKVREQRRAVLIPYEEIVQQRSRLEEQCAKLAGDRAMSDSPYQPFSEQELPFLVEKLRKEGGLDVVASFTMSPSPSSQPLGLVYDVETQSEYDVETQSENEDAV